MNKKLYHYCLIFFICLLFYSRIQAKEIEYSFNDLFTMSVSDKMELRNADDSYTHFQNEVLNLDTSDDIVFQQKNLGNMKPSAATYYCRILIKLLESEDEEGSFPCYNDLDFTQDDLDSSIELAKDFIEKDKQDIKKLNPSFDANSYGFLTEPVASIETNSNGLVYIKVHYLRTGLKGAGDVSVDMCLYFNKHHALLCFFSYRDFEKEMWQSVLSNAQNSINWLKKYPSTNAIVGEATKYPDDMNDKKDGDDNTNNKDNKSTAIFVYWLLGIICISGLSLYYIKKKRNRNTSIFNDVLTSDFLENREKLKNGRYVIIRHIGSGGFGNTYEVKDSYLNKKCAIKEFYIKSVTQRNKTNTVSVSNSANKKIFDNCKLKFRKEAQRLTHIKNPHIVRVNDCFEENNTVYYVMDYINGYSLSEKLRLQNHPFSEKECTQILYQILYALKGIHKEGLLHMDIKPNNIMIENNKCTLIDFGASKQINHDDLDSTSTAVAYTPGYAPPEQVSGNKENWGPWTDLYALGATLYNLISDKRPPLHDELIDRNENLFHFQQNVSCEFVNLIKCLLNPRITQRPQDVDEVYKILKANSIILDKTDSEVTRTYC